MDKITQWLRGAALRSQLLFLSGNILKEQLDIPNYTGGLRLRQGATGEGWVSSPIIRSLSFSLFGGGGFASFLIFTEQNLSCVFSSAGPQSSQAWESNFSSAVKSCLCSQMLMLLPPPDLLLMFTVGQEKEDE